MGQYNAKCTPEAACYHLPCSCLDFNEHDVRARCFTIIFMLDGMHTIDGFSEKVPRHIPEVFDTLLAFFWKLSDNS